jgi:hypothetical protein
LPDAPATLAAFCAQGMRGDDHGPVRAPC